MNIFPGSERLVS
jgi:hypothetical protein